jgi:hypothetical protein
MATFVAWIANHSISGPGGLDQRGTRTLIPIDGLAFDRAASQRSRMFIILQGVSQGPPTPVLPPKIVNALFCELPIV